MTNLMRRDFEQARKDVSEINKRIDLLKIGKITDKQLLKFINTIRKRNGLPNLSESMGRGVVECLRG